MAILSIDAGTTLIKAVVLSDSGKELALAAIPTEVSQPRPGWSEQDMNEVWHAVESACRRTLQEVSTEAIDAIAVTAQGDGAWLIDSNGQPVRPAILWNDARAAELPPELRFDNLQDSIFRINGSFPSLGLPNAIMLWLAQNEPDNLAKASAVLTCGSWIYYKLTSVIGQHVSEASAPWLDISTGTVSADLMRSYGLEDFSEKIPPVLKADEEKAPLRDSLSQSWGLTPALPCVMAPYDIVTTATGSGATAPGDAFAILGTTICPGVISSEPQLDGAVTGLNLRGVGDGLFLRAFPTITGANTLSWLTRVLDLDDVPSLSALAEKSPPGSRGVLWLPYLSAAGERAPFFDPNAKGVAFGLSDFHDASDIARALLESLGYLIRESLEISGTQLTSLVLSGGGAQSSLWCQVIADATGVPTMRTSDSQVGAKGAQIYAEVAIGRYPDHFHAAQALVTKGETSTPSSQGSSLHDSRYQQFIALREAVRPLWAEGRHVG